MATASDPADGTGPPALRTSESILAPVAGREALPVLRRERLSLTRLGVALVGHYKCLASAEVAAPPAPDAYRRVPQQETSASLAELGVIGTAKKEQFTYLGRFAFLGFVSWIPRDAWVDENGTTRLSARRAVAGGLEGAMASFYLSTLFDDGTVFTTWSVSPPPVLSSRRWRCRGGTENLTATYASHLDAIAEHAERTRTRPVRIESLAEFVAASKYVDVYASSNAGAAQILLSRVLVWGAMVGAIIALVALIVRSAA